MLRRKKNARLCLQEKMICLFPQVITLFLRGLAAWQEFQLVVVLTFELCRKFIDLNINTFLTKLIVSVSMKVFNILSGEETEALNTRVMVHFSSNGSP